MVERLFRLSENKTNLRTEVLAGLTTFLTMAYIIFVQPAVLSGKMFGTDTGVDFGAVTTATCLSAALATAIMAFYAHYPIDQTPKNASVYGVNMLTTVCTALLVPFTVLCATFFAVIAVSLATCRAVRTGPA
jgi:xanthine/uracil/vitamin C permease (AzgA family)